MLGYFRLKMKIKIQLINNCLPIWMIESYLDYVGDLKNIRLNALSIYADRCLKTNIRTCGDKVHTNFGGLNVPEDRRECD